MRIAEIKKLDIANGEGIRTNVFVSGCTHNCPGCFNLMAQDFNYGRPFTKEVLDEIITYVKNPMVKGLSLLGGEPLHPNNLAGVAEIVAHVKYACPNKTVWLWSGYTIEQLMERGDAGHLLYILGETDVLVDGKFEEEKKDLSLKYRGSSNQRVIDMKKTLSTGRIELWK